MFNELQPIVIKGYNDEPIATVVPTVRPRGQARYCPACGTHRPADVIDAVNRATTIFLTEDQAAFMEQAIMVEHVEDLCPGCVVRAMAASAPDLH